MNKPKIAFFNRRLLRRSLKFLTNPQKQLKKILIKQNSNITKLISLPMAGFTKTTAKNQR